MIHSFDREIIASIQNENRRFDMNMFFKGKTSVCTPATCKTARCMAGHIVAIRRLLATALMKTHPSIYTEEQWDTKKSAYVRVPAYTALARKIYQIETGKVCRLDFWGRNYRLNGVMRSEAADHILNQSDIWPQLTDYQLAESTP